LDARRAEDGAPTAADELMIAAASRRRPWTGRRRAGQSGTVLLKVLDSEFGPDPDFDPDFDPGIELA
jgi:hypothetical protein